MIDLICSSTLSSNGIGFPGNPGMFLVSVTDYSMALEIRIRAGVLLF